MLEPQNLIKFKVSGAQSFIMILLTAVIVGLVERILYDLTRTIIGTDYSYINDLSTITLHAIFAGILIFVAVVVNVNVAEKREKYAIVLFPYFITSIFLGLQVALEAATYFTYHHTQFQFYLVMTFLCAVPSMLIYFIQKNFIPYESSGSVLRIRGFIVGFVIISIIAMLFFWTIRSLLNWSLFFSV